MQIKDIFLFWNKQKIQHHIKKKQNKIYFHEGQIWWTALGKNIGYEIDGKHEPFHRPVLIIKKYNADMCFIIPLTTQIKDKNVWYQIPISHGNKKRVVNITQGRTISSRRLLHKDSFIEVNELKKIIHFFTKQFL